MSPLISTFAGASVYPYGFELLGGGRFWLATWGTAGAGQQLSSPVVSGSRVAIPTSNYGSMVISSDGTVYGSQYGGNNWPNAFAQFGYSGASVYAPVQASSGAAEFMRITAGTIDFQQKFSTSTSDNPSVCQVDTAGNIYALGVRSTGTGLVLVKYNSAGTRQWGFLLSSSAANSYTYGNTVAVDSGSNVYAAWERDTAASFDGANLVKLNSSGTVQWSKSNYNGTSDPGWYSMPQRTFALDASDNVYVGLNTIKPNTFVGATAGLYKYNSAGTQQWNRTLTGGSFYTPVGIDTDDLGNTYVVGTNASSSAIYVAKYNTSGTIQWQRSISNAGNTLTCRDYGGVTADNAGGIYITGRIGTTTSSTRPFCFRLPDDGSKTGTYSFAGFSVVYAASTLTDAAGSYTFPAGSITATSNAAGSTAGNATVTTYNNALTETVI